MSEFHGRMARPGEAQALRDDIQPGSGEGGSMSGGHVVVPGQIDVSHKVILYLEGVTVSFDGFKALNDLSLSIDNGEMRAIIGPNGAGKTTMMDVITGKTRPDAGKVFLGQELVGRPGPDKAVVFQNLSLFPWKTVVGNIEFGLRLNGIEAAERCRRIDYYVPMMGLKGFEHHYPTQLSGGMQQRVAIARKIGRAHV